jgi:NIMA (never in mitosis gene a)-related kinase
VITSLSSVISGFQGSVVIKQFFYKRSLVVYVDSDIFINIKTPLYMSPEIIEHVPYNQKTDCWSLGVLLYDITTLSHPFYDRGKESFSIRDLIDRIASCSYTRISTLMAEKKIPDIYSNHLSNVVDNLLKKDYERRWSCKNVL